MTKTLTERLKEVVEDGLTLLNVDATRPRFWKGDDTQYVQLSLAEDSMKRTLTAQLDVVIAGMEEDYSTDDGMAGIKFFGSIVLYAYIQRLKEARKELSESNQ